LQVKSDGSNLAAGAAWQRNTRFDIPNRMPHAARYRVNQKAPSVAILSLFIRREVVAENHGQRVTALL
jgi:hypothetical protein